MLIYGAPVKMECYKCFIAYLKNIFAWRVIHRQHSVFIFNEKLLFSLLLGSRYKYCPSCEELRYCKININKSKVEEEFLMTKSSLETSKLTFLLTCRFANFD